MTDAHTGDAVAFMHQPLDRGLEQKGHTRAPAKVLQAAREKMRVARFVQAQIRLPLSGIGTVTMQTVLCQNRPDITVEIDSFGFGSRVGGRNQHQRNDPGSQSKELAGP
jgi:hypothetical protein